MYDTRPSKHTLELLRSGLEQVTEEKSLTEAERAAEKMLLASLSTPGWRLQVNDPQMTINEYAKRELGEDLDIEDKTWSEAAALLLREKTWVLERSSDRKLRQRPDILKVNLHYPTDGSMPAYMTKEVIEAALKAVD